MDGPLSERARLTAWVSGRVQGVGFRWWVRVNATELGLVGTAENLADGRVRIVVEGDRASCAELLERLEEGALSERGTPPAGGAASEGGTPPAGRAAPERRRVPGRVVQVTHRWDAVKGGLTGFVER
jgi:acylphosphatase